MYLKALEVQGFKSFPDRTKITIEKGITAVVGPNGSGKSNISDAIRWVLGETSARQLRGGGKMENVIFGGTPRRSAMGFASVRLYVDNTDRRIDVNSDEVVIGRKYYRSGDSEYTVNGQNVRLKDIYELFLDTGLGRDGYSIIGQGRIAEIVGAKSAERREIFEEASGIAKYRYRKNEAERRLAGAEENLVRLRDILGELEGRVGPLEQESRKAQRFLELSARRKALEVTLWVDTVHRARDVLRELQRKIEIAQSDYRRSSEQIDAIDAETEQTRSSIEQIIREVDRYNGEIRAITEGIAGSDAKVAVLNNDISHNLQTIASLQEELAQAGQGRQELAARRAEQEQLLARTDARLAQAAADADALEARLAQLQAQSEATGEQRGALEGRLAALAGQSTDWKVAAAAVDSAVQAARGRLAAANAEQAAGGARLRQLRQELADTDALLADTGARLQRLENVKAGLAMKLESRKKALEEAEEAEQKLLREIEAAQSRRTLLKDLERSLDGFQHSVKTVMRAAEARRLRGIVGPVSTVLTVSPGWEVAIETALGYALQNIVVEDENAAKAAMAYLRSERAGRATFLPLDTVRPARFDAARLPAGARLASSLVQADARYAHIVSNLLGRIVVVDDINTASRVAKELDYRNRVVTADGQVINAGGSFTGGSVSRSAGLFSRKQEIDELKAKLARLEEKRDEAHKRTGAAREQADKLQAELTAAESEAITAGGDKIRAEAERGRIAEAIARQEKDGAQLADECRALQERLDSETAAGEQARANLQQAQAETSALEEQLAALAGSDSEFLSVRNRLSEELNGLKMERLALEKDRESHRAALQSLEGRAGEDEARAEKLRQNITMLEAQNEESRRKIDAVQAAIQAGKEEISAREQAIDESSRRRLELEGTIEQERRRQRQLTDEREAMAREAERLGEQRQAKDDEYQQTVAKLWDEYELSLPDAEALCSPFDSVAELRRQVGEVRGQIRALGSVNVGAIDEYAEVNQRYQFLRAQVDDVEKSKAELHKLIGGLCEEMRTLFSEHFAQINRNFARIFAELFGGGTARLYLEDESDVLESGIAIEVSPPGKIIRDLSALSGGEQALVAISIYFAILAVNPAPFCVLDEIEAALDDVNVVRFAQYLRRICGRTQFVVITHRRGTMEEADVLYGVTMQEDGVSKVLKLDVANVDASLVS